MTKLHTTAMRHDRVTIVCVIYYSDAVGGKAFVVPSVAMGPGTAVDYILR